MAAIYRGVIKSLDKVVPSRFQPFWNHAAGPKTIHFWAPTFKWGLVIAGLADLKRPVTKLSTTQSGALAATGCIWARYSMVIIPKNWNLFSVNIFVGATGIYQVSRIINHYRSLHKGHHGPPGSGPPGSGPPDAHGPPNCPKKALEAGKPQPPPNQ